MLLAKVCERTNQYIATVSKAERKSLGQFFTSIKTAEYMASLCAYTRSSARILDPGAGSGILSAAIIEKLILSTDVKSIILVSYENDPNILPLLRDNIAFIQQFCREHKISFAFEIRIDNFITANSFTWKQQIASQDFDIVICNPPYKKIARTSAEALTMEEIIHGQPNIYFLFMAMALSFLKIGGNYVFIVPRSWTSGLYFTAFRDYFFKHINITNIHLFASRDRVFDKEEVLQETMILSGVRSQDFQQETISITTSDGTADFDNLQQLDVSKFSCIQACNGHYFLLPSTRQEIDVLHRVNSFDASVEERGYKFKTGQVVDFRNREFLRSEESPCTWPIIWPLNFVNGRIIYPNESVENQYILKSCRSLLMPDQNYLMIKRFTAKEERRRLQPALYISLFCDNKHYISTENHLNYLTKKDGNLSDYELYGFFVLLSSTLWDQYYRILNGSTQVNAAELNSMPIPPEADIRDLGRLAMQQNDLSTPICNQLLEDYYENR